MKKTFPYSIILIAICMVVVGCATKENNAKSRFLHSLHAHYNIYYNGDQAFKDGMEAQESGNVDNYLQTLPLYIVGNKKTLSIGTGSYERAIEKAEKAIKRHSIKRRPIWKKERRKNEREKLYYARREFNPFIWKAWLLLGRSQFQKGDFVEALSTFSYMERLYINQPDKIALARIWKARCYVEMNWLYDADDVFNKIRLDSMPNNLKGELASSKADYFVRSSNYKEAVPQLRNAIRHEKSHRQKARLYYLLGQLAMLSGDKETAFKAFRKTTNLHPTYELTLNARVKMAETASGKSNAQIVRQLTSMAHSEKNKDYLDQIYYAIGNTYLNRKDTVRAISNYEKGIEKSTRGGDSKSILALHLAEIYWKRNDYINSNRCYAIALGLIDKEHTNYEQIKWRSEVLADIAPHLEEIKLQDSLQALASMSEADRMKAIDRIIERVKREEAEAKRKSEEAAQANTPNGLPQQQNNQVSTPVTSRAGTAAWYFYNPTLISKGKDEFQKKWGKRAQEDNWRRSNRTVVNFGDETTGEQQSEEEDSIAAQMEELPRTDANDSVANDNKSREYYLKDIPFTAEQKKESNKKLAEALFASGVILKDRIENFPMAEATFRRLLALDVEFDKTELALFNTYQLYSRLGRHSEADEAKARLQSEFSKSRSATLLDDPLYEFKAKYGKIVEDSLYASTYSAFNEGQYEEVYKLNAISAKEYPEGQHRAKFIFIDALSNLQEGRPNDFIAGIKNVVENYPENEITSLAGYMLRGIKEGRKLSSAKYSASSIWSQRTSETANADSTSAANGGFTANRIAPYAFVIAYEQGTLNEGQLLYDVAQYNFSNFMVRNFDMQVQKAGVINEIVITGFVSLDEALLYKQRLFRNKKMAESLASLRTIIIEESNLSLLGLQFSFADYDDFYNSQLAPIKAEEKELDDAEPVVEEEE